MKEYVKVQDKIHLMQSELKTNCWDMFKNFDNIQQKTAINSISVTNNFATISTTSSSSISVYKSSTLERIKCINRSKEAITAVALRPDEKLLAAGDNSGNIQIFDMKSRLILRSFRSSAPSSIRAIAWINLTCLASVSSDKNISIWTLSEEEPLYKRELTHEDYISGISVSEPFIVTGSYDTSIKVWKLEQTSSDNEKNTLEHVCSLTAINQAPIEDVLILKNRNIFAATGNMVACWKFSSRTNEYDKFPIELCNHGKTVTSLGVNSFQSALVTGSLDGNVKIFDLESFQVLKCFYYSSPILQVKLSVNENDFLYLFFCRLTTISFMLQLQMQIYM